KVFHGNSVSTKENFSTFIFCNFYIRFYLFKMWFGNQRANICFGIKWISDFELLYFFNKILFEFFVNRFFNKNPASAKANLALVCEGGTNCYFQHFFIIAIGKDEVWVFSPEFQRKFFEHGCGGSGNVFAGFGSTRKRNCFYVFMLHNRLPRGRARSVNDI